MIILHFILYLAHVRGREQPVEQGPRARVQELHLPLPAARNTFHCRMTQKDVSFSNKKFDNGLIK